MILLVRRQQLQSKANASLPLLAEANITGMPLQGELATTHVHSINKMHDRTMIGWP